LIKHLRRVDRPAQPYDPHGAGASPIAAGRVAAPSSAFTTPKEDNHESLDTKDHSLFVV
jgi:hypothetical protein